MKDIEAGERATCALARMIPTPHLYLEGENPVDLLGKCGMAEHVAQGLAGALGPGAEKFVDKTTGFFNKTGWDMMYKVYLADHLFSTPSGNEKHGSIGKDLKVGALCHDISSYAASSMLDRLKVKGARITGKATAYVLPHAARVVTAEGNGSGKGTRKVKSKSKSPGLFAKVSQTIKGVTQQKAQRITQAEEARLQKAAENAYKDYVEAKGRINSTEATLRKNSSLGTADRDTIKMAIQKQKDHLDGLKRKAIETADEAHTRAQLLVGWKAVKRGGGGRRTRRRQ